MKPIRYERVTAGYVAYGKYNDIVGVILRMDDQSLQRTIKRAKRRNRRSVKVGGNMIDERG